MLGEDDIKNEPTARPRTLQTDWAPAGRKLRVGRVLGTYLSILRANAGRIALITLVTQAPFYVAIVLSTLVSISDIVTAVVTTSSANFLSGLAGTRYAGDAYTFTFFVGPILSFYTAAALTRAAGSHLATGRFLPVSEALVPGLGFTLRTAAVIVETEILCIVSVIGFVLALFAMLAVSDGSLIPILILSPILIYLIVTLLIGMFIPALSIINDEGIGAVAAMPASKHMTAGNRWPVCAAISLVFICSLLLVLISILIGRAVSAIPLTAEWIAPIRWLWPLISCFLLNGLFAALTSIFLAVVYEELRFLRDGPRADTIVAVFD